MGLGPRYGLVPAGPAVSPRQSPPASSLAAVACCDARIKLWLGRLREVEREKELDFPEDIWRLEV